MAKSKIDQFAKEDKKNITENEALISDIGSLRDALDKVRTEIYSLESKYNSLLTDIKEQKNDSTTMQELQQINNKI